MDGRSWERKGERRGWKGSIGGGIVKEVSLGLLDALAVPGVGREGIDIVFEEGVLS